VEQITFSGEYAAETNQPILFITERAVFRLTPKGIMLVEIAPGVDLEKHILAKMEYKPLIADDLKLMDARIFRDAPMGLAF
jgi:propionate CoA-transferase